MRGAVSVPQLVAVAIGLALIAAAAWWFLGSRGNAPTTMTKAPVSATTPGAEPAAGPVPVDSLSADQLYKEARAAMGENRMVSPPGNNALEYYLKILAKQPDDSGATDALRELFPFATGSAEEQINQGNFDEATRIMNLLAKADPSNYTLTILRSKLDAKKKQSDREQQLAAQQAAGAAAAAAAKASNTASAPANSETAAAAPAADASAAPTTAAAQKPKQTVASATPAPAVAPPTPAEPVGETRDAKVVTPPRPSYPPAAARNRQDGWVEVEFVVAADGSVQNAKVVGSNPSRTFDGAALSAIKQAKFEPRLDKGQAVASTLRRRIEFKLGQ
ncbi:MAG: energy transducer TonB [Lysobacterales bacterium]